jgi:hypothetical protein
MRLRLGVPAFAAAVGLCIAVGCGGGGGGGNGGGGGSSGNAAVDATLPKLEASMRSGATTLDATITSGTLGNPLVAPTSSTSTATVGGSLNDGTVTNVTVSSIVSFNTTTGSYNQATTVSETSSNFQFLSESLNISAPNFSIRPAPSAAANLTSATGTGQYFAILTIGQTETGSRLFTNTSSTSMATLVNFGTITPLPVANLTGTFTKSQDYLLGYQITGVKPALTATLVTIVKGSGTTISTRNGGPQVSQLGFNFTNVSFAGVGANTNGDVGVGIANDFPAGISPNAAVNVQGNLTGGFGVAVVQTTVTVVSGPLLNGQAPSTSTTINVTTSFAGLLFLNNGQLDTEQPIFVQGAQTEDPLNNQAFRHSLDSALTNVGGLKTALYGTEQTSRVVAFYVYQ